MKTTKKIVSIIDYRASLDISHVRRLLENAQEKQKVNPRNWKTENREFRSLTIYDDGSCHLQRLTVGSIVRKLKDGAMMKGLRF